VLLKGLRGTPGEAADAGAFVEEAALGRVGGALRTAVRRTLYFPDSSRGWVRPAVAAARRAHRARPFDAVLSSSPPLSAHLAAARLAESEGLPLVLDFRDLWGPAVAGTPERAVRLHRTLLGGAARVVTVSEGYAAWLGEHGSRAAAAVVTNGFEEAPAARAGAAEGAGPRTLLHAGSTYAGRQDFGRLARLVEESSKGGRLRLVLLGHADGPTRAALAPFAARGAVEVRPFGTHAAALEAQASASAILVWAWSGSDPVARGHLPAKLFEALPSGRPVLLLADRGSEAWTVGARLGLRPRDPADEPGVREALADLAAGREPAGCRPDASAAAAHSRTGQARRLAAVLDEAVGARP
jgi:hypothetical protein